jgi:hypothetical protein
MNNRARLEAELAQVRSLLETIPAKRFFERMGLESRAAELQEELTVFDSGPLHKRTKVAIFFGGRPVVGTLGIDARFAAEAIQGYQEVISKVFATQIVGELGASGPIPLEDLSHLHITDLPRGSFGFQLEDLGQEAPLALFPQAPPLTEAVERANTIIAAASESDEAFADAMDEVGDRVYSAIKGFFVTIASAEATFRLESEKMHLSFDAARVSAAVARATAERTEEIDIPMPGTFLGVLAGSGKFEHRSESGSVLAGRISTNRRPEEFADWFNKRCVAHLRVMTLRKSGREWKRYSLLRIESSASA